MNNTISSFLLFAIFLIGSSCKSEVKSNPTITEELGETSPAILTSASDDSTAKEDTSTDYPRETETIGEIEKVDNKSPKGKHKEKKEIDTKVSEPKPKANEPNEDIAKDKIMIDTDTTTQKSEEVEPERPSKPERIDKFVGIPNHNLLDGLLKAYVSQNGKVDYAGLKSKEAKLDEYLSILENHPPGTTWNRDHELAFWINAYNAFTLKLILKNYPVGSITELHGGKPWDVKWINLDGKNLSLNNIENDIIRPKYNEPRIHFAVNCAAKSCPPLLNEAYKANLLETQLDSQTKKFINNTAYNTLGKNEIIVSKIFDWYKEDFGNVAGFVMRYANTTVKPSAKVTFKEYDWSLNGK